MTAWKITVLVLLLFGAIAPNERWHRIRVGAVMLLASFAAAFFPNIWFYLALELAAGFLILLPPKTKWQSAIAYCYIGMAMLTIGFVATLEIFSSAAGNSEMLKVGYDLFAWIAAGFLFLWGVDGILQSRGYRIGDCGSARSARSGFVG